MSKIMINGKEFPVGGGQCQEIYSTKETRIGTWIDGKPLYRKVFSGNIPSNIDNTTVVYAPFIDSTVEAKRIYGGIYSNQSHTSVMSIPCNYYSDTLNWSISLIYTPNIGIRINIITQNITLSGNPAWVVLEYTKTTDDPT